ncbi:MAG: hypothetical protein C3F18_06670 [Nitrosomonadales bacterium]|nr:MAG: hypothetical protein C3F18_06670 [Nitrosomonadales bacterium]
MSRQPSIFISHKHADRQIATELRKFLDRWSRKEIPVFQSSAPLAKGPRLGHALTEELKQALWDTGVVFLIYTTEDQDWSYCMWECGVATKPEAPQTRIIVLQCGAETPRVFEDQVRVDVRDRGDVLKLVKDYLTDPGFFPGASTAIAPKLYPDGPEVQEAATELHKKLSAVIPKCEVAEWPALPLVRLELKTDKIEKATCAAATLADFEKSVLIREMDPRALQIFGMANVDAGTSFGSLAKHWAEGKTDASPAWVEDMRAQIVRAAHGKIPALLWSQLEEADGPEHYTPMLTRWRQVPALDVLQFDVSLVPFESSKVLPGIGDPYQMEYRNAMKKVESFAPALVPYLTPIAARCFNEWSEYVRKVVGDGTEMRGPERLEITRLLVRATKKHMLVERVVGNPQALHSRDWLAFYDELGKHAEVEKAWMLCVKESEVRSNLSEVEAAWRFFKDKQFRTLYCSPRDVERSIGEALQGHEVIEDFGKYVKLLSLPDGSYTAGAKANVLVTTIREASPEDRRLLRSMVDCSTPMTEDWLRSLRDL